MLLIHIEYVAIGQRGPAGKLPNGRKSQMFPLFRTSYFPPLHLGMRLKATAWLRAQGQGRRKWGKELALSGGPRLQTAPKLWFRGPPCSWNSITSINIDCSETGARPCSGFRGSHMPSGAPAQRKSSYCSFYRQMSSVPRGFLLSHFWDPKLDF